MRAHPWLRLLALLVCLSCATTLAAGPRFDNAEYAARRANLMAKIPDGVAIIWGAQAIPSYYRYAQNNDFMYLTGAEIPDAVLIVDGQSKTSTLVFTSTEAAARAEGISAELVKDPRAFTGIERVAPIEAWTRCLPASRTARRSSTRRSGRRSSTAKRAWRSSRTLQRNMTLNPWDGRLTRELQFVKLFRERFPLVEVRDCSALIWELRTIKSPAEIALLRRAGKIGAAAHTEMIKATRPGMYEYELSALFNYVCEKAGRAGERLRRHHLVRARTTRTSTTTGTTGS